MHNHPSGEPEPSNADIAIIKRVVDACNLMDMTGLDHIVIAKNKGDYVCLSSE
ncbi:MAG: JAB domain-containing protein [Euryarchaeota archaeon]|nr:JAB domain-containing protein [Euryarchaeota archaeon]